MGFGTSKPPLLGCTGTSVHLGEILTTSRSSESPQAELVSASRCPALFLCLSNSFLGEFMKLISNVSLHQDPHSPQQRDDQEGHLPERRGPLPVGCQQEPPQVCWGGTGLIVYFSCGTFQPTSQWLDAIRNGLNGVCRLLWRSTAPLMKKWPPVWRWLTPNCLHWLVLSRWAAHPIVWTQHSALFARFACLRFPLQYWEYCRVCPSRPVSFRAFKNLNRSY